MNRLHAPIAFVAPSRSCAAGIALVFAIALGTSSPPFAQPPADLPELAPYRDATNIVGATPASEDGAVGALFNPAQWGVLEKPELALWWSDRNVRPNGLDSWGTSFGRGVGFSVRRTDARIGPEGALRSVSDFQLGFGGGD